MKKMSIVILSVCVGILSYINYVFNGLLTKKEIWSKIDDVDDIVINCMSKNGNKSITQSDLYDFAMMYIFNRENEKISKINISKNDFNNEKKQIGFIESKEVYNVIDKYFDKFDLVLDENMSINMEPCDYIFFDSKEIVYFDEDLLIVKYTRTFLDDNYNLYVIYNIDYDNKKILNVRIYNSIIY